MNHSGEHRSDGFQSLVGAVSGLGAHDAVAGEEVERGAGLGGRGPGYTVEPGLVAGRELGGAFRNVEGDG
ncbi:MAG: hypothetical protein L0271_27305 [Gemmatimonadetes bacterium]|nr:hypothetical protein [Gemmatimonadota bacterium]